MKRCEQYTLDVERSHFQQLSVKDRIALKVHFGICPKCRRYLKDSQQLDLWLKRRFQLSEAEFQFTREEKQALKEKLK
jgi:Zn-finger nucleic acid-binding protein